MEGTESRKQARVVILDLAHMMSAPMSLNAIVRLQIADAIWQDGSNTPLSAAEILTRVLPSGDANNLQRMLRMLASYGVFKEHIVAGGDERKYALTEAGKMLVTDDEGLSYGPYVLQHHQDALMRAWALVHETVVDPTKLPFEKVHGETPSEYYRKRPEMNELMLKAMSGASVPFMRAMLEGYDNFQGVEKLVDVGGSGGDCLRMILQKHPNIKEGINFDLPGVVAKAPQIPAMSDEECKQIMQNCYKSLPQGGKLIVCEPMLPEHSDDSHRTRALLGADIFVMTIYGIKGKHRTEKQFKQLAISAGFPGFRSFHFDYFHTILEFQKE